MKKNLFLLMFAVFATVITGAYSNPPPNQEVTPIMQQVLDLFD